jgi:hypothetical protein
MQIRREARNPFTISLAAGIPGAIEPILDGDR